MIAGLKALSCVTFFERKINVTETAPPRFNPYVFEASVKCLGLASIYAEATES